MAHFGVEVCHVPKGSTLWLRRWLGRLQLDELTREDIEEAFKVRATGGPASTSAKGLGHDTLVKLRATLHMALDSANRKQWIRWNAAVGVEIPEAAKAPTKRKSFSVTQVERLIAAAHQDDRYGALWITMLSAGLRPGEATGLARGDVDLDEAVVHVAHSVARVPGDDGRQALRPGPVKAGSEQTVALPPSAVAAIKEALCRPGRATGTHWPRVAGPRPGARVRHNLGRPARPIEPPPSIPGRCVGRSSPRPASQARTCQFGVAIVGDGHRCHLSEPFTTVTLATVCFANLGHPTWIGDMPPAEHEALWHAQNPPAIMATTHQP